jgi:uncharacterized protein YfbU (UPF0304 family)
MRKIDFKKILFEKRVVIYSPEAHGFQTGSNNGNYEESVRFMISKSGRYYLKFESSSDGDMSSFPSWEKVTPEEWVAHLELAIKANLGEIQEED